MEEFEARDTEDWGPFPVLQDAFAGQNPWLYVRIKHLRIFWAYIWKYQSNTEG